MTQPLPEEIEKLRQEWHSLTEEQILSGSKVYSRARNVENLRSLLTRFERYEVVFENLSVHFMRTVMKDHLSMYHLFLKWAQMRKNWSSMAFHAVFEEYDLGFSKVVTTLEGGTT